MTTKGKTGYDKSASPLDTNFSLYPDEEFEPVEDRAIVRLPHFVENPEELKTLLSMLKLEEANCRRFKRNRSQSPSPG